MLDPGRRGTPMFPKKDLPGLPRELCWLYCRLQHVYWMLQYIYIYTYIYIYEINTYDVCIYSIHIYIYIHMVIALFIGFFIHSQLFYSMVAYTFIANLSHWTHIPDTQIVYRLHIYFRLYYNSLSMYCIVYGVWQFIPSVTMSLLATSPGARCIAKSHQ